MDLLKCILYDSGNYRWCSGVVENTSNVPTQSQPVGIVLHSTGDSTTHLKRYVQPSKTDPEYSNLLKKIGTNTNGNSWNRPASKKCVHYMIGKLADGTLATAQLLPEEFACWGLGSGKNGSYNYFPTQHIQIEMQDGNNDVFAKVWEQAVELCVDICNRYGWSEQVIVSHKEAYKLGYASNHADCDKWFSQNGKTMDDFRGAVKKAMTVTEIRKGDIVNFVGDKQWSNANKADALYKTAKPGKSIVKAVYSDKYKHSVQLKAVASGEAKVNGYVDREDVEPIEVFIPDVGEKINFIGSKQWSTANKLDILSKKATPCVAIVKQIYHLGSSKHPFLVYGQKVNGWVNQEDIEKIN